MSYKYSGSTRVSFAFFIFLIVIMAFIAIRNFSTRRTIENESYEPPPAEKSLAKPKKVKTSSSASVGITQPKPEKIHPEVNKPPAPPVSKPAQEKALDPDHLTKEQFFKKYSKVPLEKLLKDAKPYVFGSPDYSPFAIVPIRYALSTMIKGSHLKLRHSIGIDSDSDQIDPGSCIAFQWRGIKSLGVFGKGTLKIYESSVPDVFIEALHDRYYFLRYGDTFRWHDVKDPILVLFYARNKEGKIIYQDRLDKGLFISSPSTVSNFEFCRNIFKNP